MHKAAAIIPFGEQRVVRSAHQAQIFRGGIAAASEGHIVVMQLEKAAASAALTVLTDKRALAAIAIVDLSHHSARNIT